MTCPNCRSENEMVFSALVSSGFICQEAECGFEFEMECRTCKCFSNPRKSSHSRRVA